MRTDEKKKDSKKKEARKDENNNREGKQRIKIGKVRVSKIGSHEGPKEFKINILQKRGIDNTSDLAIAASTFLLTS